MSVSSIATLSRAMSSPDLHHRSACANPALRASDADRGRAADALRRPRVDGRLDTDELQDRLGRCYAARTTGDLAALFADLPAGDEPRAAGGRSGPKVSLVAVALAAVVALVALSVALHGHPGPFPLLAVFLFLRLGRGPRRPWPASSRRA